MAALQANVQIQRTKCPHLLYLDVLAQRWHSFHSTFSGNSYFEVEQI